MSGGFNAARRRTNFAGSGLSGVSGGSEVISSTINNFGVSLDVSWELDVWGRVLAVTRAAVADVQAAQADYAGVRLSIPAYTTKAWLAAVIS